MKRQYQIIDIDKQMLSTNASLPKNPVKEDKSCTENCNLDDIDIFNELKLFFDEFDMCTLPYLDKFLNNFNVCSSKNRDQKLLGHPVHCYEKPLLCSSKFLKLQIVVPHFPKMRTLEHNIYTLISMNKDLQDINDALNTVDKIKLQDIYEKSEIRKLQIENQKYLDIDLNERSIRENFKTAFKCYHKRMQELPTNHCVSCEKLICKGKLKLLSKYKDKIDNPLWSKLLRKYEKDENNEQFICNYCFDKFKANKMPSWSTLNRLKVKPVPECISNLNMFEKILIQRYKAFQVVHKFETKLDKHLPGRCKIDAVKGQTFHLPIPLQETLNKIASKTAPINNDHELYILVRGIPTKANVVWESLVDLKKVWTAF